MRSAFELAGDIRGVDLLASLVSLWRERGSGTLRFSRSGATAGFAILEGNIVSSLSSQAQFDVAAILTRAGKLDPAAIERLATPEGGDAEIAALQAGVITGREWKWGQKIRAIEILSDVLGWLEGDYEWDPSEAPASGEWTLPVPRLLLELFLRSRDRTLVEHYLGPADLPLVRAERFQEEFKSFGLTPDAASVVRLIDGRATAEEIAGKAPADEFAVLKLLAALTTLGLVHPAEAAPGAAAPRKKRRDRTRESRETPAPMPAVPREPERAPEPEPPPEPEIREEAEAPGPAPEAGEQEVPEEIEEPFPEPPLPEATADAFPEWEARPEPPPEPLPVLPFEPAADPADLIRSPYETRGAPNEPGYSIDREPRIDLSHAGGSPPPAGRGGGSGVLLAALLAALVIAVAFLVVMRSRSGSAPEAVAPPTRPTAAKEVLVFPPAETAIPLARRTRGVSTTPGAVPPVRTPTRAPAPPTARPTLEPTRPPTAPPTRPAPSSTSTATATRPAPTRSPTARPTPPAPTKTATLVPTRPAPTKTPTLVPTRPAPTKTRTLVPTRPAPTNRPPTAVPTRPAPTRPPTPAPIATPAAAAEGGSARADWIRRAERDRQSLSRRRNARYSVQLELACEIETLQKAWAWDKPSGTMWLLTTSYRGRTCFRVLWGHYATLAQAQAARARIPGFFVALGNRPVVVSVR